MEEIRNIALGYAVKALVWALGSDWQVIALALWLVGLTVSTTGRALALSWKATRLAGRGLRGGWRKLTYTPPAKPGEVCAAALSALMRSVKVTRLEYGHEISNPWLLTHVHDDGRLTKFQRAIGGEYRDAGHHLSETDRPMIVRACKRCIEEAFNKERGEIARGMYADAPATPQCNVGDSLKHNNGEKAAAKR